VESRLGSGSLAGNGGSFLNNSSVSEEEKQLIIKYIDELKYADKRDNALVELSRQREHFSELAPFIWHSVGTIAALLQEIVSVYPQLSPPNLDTKTSNKACNVLALLQCVASHKETRQLFLKAHIPLFLYPFLNTVSKGRPFEYLRLTSLGVIGALVKMDDTEVISFLLQTEIIPLCLRIMERGTELSQTVATFIIQKILLGMDSLHYLNNIFR
jgi:CCR4-NOT transcription complex subunit 9